MVSLSLNSQHLRYRLIQLRHGGRLSRSLLIYLITALLVSVLALNLSSAYIESRRPNLPATSIMLGPHPFPLVEGQAPEDLPLQPAPFPGMIEETPEGNLPTLSPDGIPAYKAYAAPFDTTETRPRIGIVLYDIGLTNAQLLDAIHRLPGAVGLGFSVFTPNLPEAMARARKSGHETLLTLPGDPRDSSELSDPGSGALRRFLSAEDNLQRLRILMGQASGYVALLNDPKTATFDDPSLSETILDELRHRGIALVTTDTALIARGENLGSPVSSPAIDLDPFSDPKQISATLQNIETRTKSKGSSLIIAPAYPNIVNHLAHWLPSLYSKGIAIAPASTFITEHENASAPISSSAPPSSRH